MITLQTIQLVSLDNNQIKNSDMQKESKKRNWLLFRDHYESLIQHHNQLLDYQRKHHI